MELRLPPDGDELSWVPGPLRSDGDALVLFLLFQALSPVRRLRGDALRLRDRVSHVGHATSDETLVETMRGDHGISLGQTP